MNDDLAYLPILKRVGLVLIVVGLIDVGWMIYCIVHRMNYKSSLNIFAIIAGVFLMRGSLRTAKAISLYGALMLTGLIGIALLWPVFVPLGLAVTALRIYPMLALAYLTYVIGFLVLLLWVVHQLRSEPVLAASIRSGIKVRSLIGPVFAGLALVVFVVLVSRAVLSSDRAKRAEQIAASEVGGGYRFSVISMKTMRTSNGKTDSAVVTAWNDHEIRAIPVSWSE